MNKNYFWTKKETEILKRLGSSLTAKELAKKIPNKSWISITHKRKQLEITAPGVLKHKWSFRQLNYLKKYGSQKSASELSKIIKKPIFVIQKKRRDLGIKVNQKDIFNKSTKKEDEIIKENLNLLDKDIAKKLPGRNKSFVITRRLQLGLKKRLDINPFPKIFNRWFKSEYNNNKKLNEFNYGHHEKTLLTLQCPKNEKHIITKKITNFRNIYDKYKKINCPFCKGFETIFEESLKGRYPKLCKNFSKKNKITPDKIPFKTFKRFYFKCEKGHENLHYIKYLTVGGNKHDKPKKDFHYVCEQCENPTVYLDKSLHKYIDFKKNKLSELKKIRINETKRKIWIKVCNFKNHSWKISPSILRSTLNRYKKINCSFCYGKQIDVNTNSLYAYLKNSELIFDKQNKENPKQVFFNSTKEFYFRCKKRDHLFKRKASFIYRKRKGKPVCRVCEEIESSLKFNNPNLFKEIDTKKNKNFENLSAFTHKELWWKCLKNESHPSWKASVALRSRGSSNCKLCENKTRGIIWTQETVRLFLKSIRDHIATLTPAEKFLIFQQTGMPSRTTSSYKFIKDFASGKIPIEEIDRFIEGKEDTTISETVNKINNEISEQITFNENKNDKNQKKIEDEKVNGVVKAINDSENEDNDKLPNISTKQVLKTLTYLVRNVNQEAIEFLIASAKHKIWKDVFRDEVQAIKDLKSPHKDEYVKRVQSEFINEFKRAKALSLPRGYSFPHKPNLMQKLTAAKVIHEKRVGNWSGTGAGKTLSAVLASRYIGAKNVVVCCPNALAQRMDTGWANEIVSIFPDTNVQLKSFEPLKTKTNNYYVLNYESFQQKDSSKKIVEFLKNVKVDFVIIDEIHYSKQRVADNLSLRKKNITSMLAEIQKNNKNLYVLGMSATPVINNLYEGRSLVEMITGEVHKDLPTQININNCMKLHQKLATVGLRWMPDYQMKLTSKIEEIDCSHITDQVRDLGKNPTPLELEKMLTREKIETIKKHLEPKTMIYTHYLDDIDSYLKEEIEKEGYSVGMFTGEDKSGLEEFKNGSLDVLIGSRTIGTGVNGLQNVCRKIIINSLPWTNAEYEQLIGRVYRQGQKRDVEIIIPLTEGTVNGEKWSWCKSRYDRIKFKKTVGDAAVDGIIPSEQIRTESQVLQDLMKWIERISNEDDFEVKREPIKSEFIFDDSDQVKRIAKFGDFSRMNREWNNSKSSTTHEKIKNNPDIWRHYHQMFEENKKAWTVVPTSELIKYFKARDGLEIGDFGCGKALLHENLSEKHIVHSFDHHAINKNVTACDISKTPLNNKQLDVAIYSLSLMGINIADYIKEANRVLKLDGRLFIVEASIRFKDIDQFKRQLIQFGFDHLSVKEIGKFTQIKADKTKDIHPEFTGNLEF